MKYSTPNAIRQIKLSHHKTVLVDGEKCCTLIAMTMALNYHQLDITETTSCLTIKGVVPVERHDKYLLK